MIAAGVYSFNRGKEVIEKKFYNELIEITKCINSVVSENHKNKVSKEKTMPGKMLYSPPSLNRAFKDQFNALG